jgi:hypothetical protein
MMTIFTERAEAKSSDFSALFDYATDQAFDRSLASCAG